MKWPRISLQLARRAARWGKALCTNRLMLGIQHVVWAQTLFPAKGRLSWVSRWGQLYLQGEEEDESRCHAPPGASLRQQVKVLLGFYVAPAENHKQTGGVRNIQQLCNKELIICKAGENKQRCPEMTNTF